MTEIQEEVLEGVKLSKTAAERFYKSESMKMVTIYVLQSLEEGARE